MAMVRFLRVARDVLVEKQFEAAKYLLPASFYKSNIKVSGVTIPFPESKILREAVFEQSYAFIRDNTFKYIPKDQHPKNIIDLGASYGIIAANYATMYPDANVMALEPDPLGYEYGQRLIDINRISNLSLFNVAADTRAGNRNLYVNTERCEYSSFFKTDANSTGSSRIVAVECVDIAQFIREHNIDKIGLLKVDIEGAEFGVFQHLDKAGLLAIVDNIFAEIHLDYNDYEDTRLSSLIGIFEDNGYYLKIHSTGSDATLSRLLLWGSKTALVT